MKYDIAGDPQGQTLLLIHGWPDTAELWDPLLPCLSGYRCVRVTLPGFSPDDPRESHASFSELVDQLGRLIVLLQEGRDDPAVQVIGHDFGAILAYLLESRYPERVKSIVALDVGGRFSLRGPGHLAFVAGYQGWLLCAWWIGGAWPKVADRMTRWLARLARAPRPESARSTMNYLYFYLWRDDPLGDCYRPGCPVLYLYGSGKRYPFHSEEWLEELRRRPDCEVHAIAGAGHWFLRSRAPETGQRIESWLRVQRELSVD